jgi:hypothetical protein
MTSTVARDKPLETSMVTSQQCPSWNPSVFVDSDKVTGVIDWSEAGQGDALYDLATLTLGHEERLDDVLAGYGTDVDLDVIRGWWSWRSLVAARWLIEHGFDPSSPGAEFDVLRSRM